MTKKKKNYRQENTYLRQRIRELESQLNDLSPKKPKLRETAPATKPGQAPLKGTQTNWENYDPSYLPNDLRRSIVLTVIIITALLLLWRWGDPLFQYLPL